MATTSVAGTLRIEFDITEVSDAGVDGSTKLKKHRILENPRISYGTSGGQANKAWSSNYTPADGATQDVDLVGTLTDDAGDTINLDEIVALCVRNNSTTQTSSVVGDTNNLSSMFTGDGEGVKLVPQSLMLMMLFNKEADGWAVSAGSDTFSLVNSAGAAGDVDAAVAGIDNP